MTATDELRRLLDERGVEWWPSEGDPAHLTVRVADDVRYKYRQVGRGVIVSACTEGAVTPAQAVEATLGQGTCKAVSMRERDKRPYLHDELVCSECGCQLAHEFERVWQRFCPNCGRKVVS